VTTPESFFDIPDDREPMRGPGGSPLLVPRGIDPASNIRAEYTRASYMADFLEDKTHIHRWEMRYLAKALGQHEDLAALAAVEKYSTGVSDALVGRDKSASGRRLDSIIERALDRVRIHEKADRGTAVHCSTEPGAPGGVERLRAATGAFFEINRRELIKIVGTEVFTANDTTMSAGTFDHLVEVPGHPLLTGLVVADKKTGSFSPFEWCIQVSSYANGECYNVETDTRPAWPGEVNKDWGLVWQIDAESAEVKLWIIDIAFGWEMAQLAAQVRDGHKRRDIAVEYKSATFEQRLAACNTRDDLALLWKSTDELDLRTRVEEKVRSL
jgi:hypothetical protein